MLARVVIRTYLQRHTRWGISRIMSQVCAHKAPLRRVVTRPRLQIAAMVLATASSSKTRAFLGSFLMGTSKTTGGVILRASPHPAQAIFGMSSSLKTQIIRHIKPSCLQQSNWRSHHVMMIARPTLSVCSLRLMKMIPVLTVAVVIKTMMVVPHLPRLAAICTPCRPSMVIRPEKSALACMRYKHRARATQQP
jgi:hypothetical protein